MGAHHTLRAGIVCDDPELFHQIITIVDFLFITVFIKLRTLEYAVVLFSNKYNFPIKSGKFSALVCPSENLKQIRSLNEHTVYVTIYI